MNIASPKLVVAIPAYNAEPYIEAAVRSALGQHPDVNVLVSDNASTDNTIARVEELNSDRVRIHRQARNLGSHENFNWLLNNCDGDVIAFLCADDLMLPGHLARQIELLDEDPAVKLVGCNMIETSADLTQRCLLRTAHGRWRGRDLNILSVNTLSNLFGGPSNFVFRRRDVGSVRFDARWSWLSDLDFAARLVGEGYFINSGHVGYLYRRHAATGSANLDAADGNLLHREWAEYFLEHNGSAPQSNRASRRNVQDDLLIQRLEDQWREYGLFRRSTYYPQILNRVVRRAATIRVGGSVVRRLVRI